MDYLQLKLQTNKQQAEFISEILMGLDALSTTFLDTVDDAIFEPPVGEMPLWAQVTITALFDLHINKSHILQTLKEICQVEATFEVLADRVWEDECKKDFHPMKFGKRLWICPSWEEVSSLPSDALVIDMDPGLAFGTGTHQTTHLCLEYLDSYPPKNLRVIDYGTGTGILAIAAKKLGAFEVTAIDNDPQAVLATLENAKRNQIKIQVLHTDNEGSLAPTDLLIANILANPLMDLCVHFSTLVKTGGRLVLSGILHTQIEAVLLVYGQYFEQLSVTQKDDWCCLNGVKI
jgi:ribosomal protein L11 methyltransferase